MARQRMDHKHTSEIQVTEFTSCLQKRAENNKELQFESQKNTNFDTK
jgi:hypothetical protein